MKIPHCYWEVILGVLGGSPFILDRVKMTAGNEGFQVVPRKSKKSKKRSDDFGARERIRTQKKWPILTKNDQICDFFDFFRIPKNDQKVRF